MEIISEKNLTVCVEVSKLFPNTDDDKSDFTIENHNVAKIIVSILMVN